MSEEQEQALSNLRASNVKEFGKFSYDLEEKREQSLINQSVQMITAFSVFTIAIFTILPVLRDIQGLSFYRLLFCTGLVVIFLLASLILAVLVQWRYKYSTMKSVDEFFRSIYDEREHYKTQEQFDIQWIEQIKQIHLSKKNLNARRAKL